MDIKTYNAARGNLLARYFKAVRARCGRTAEARLRDLAKLDSQYTGEDYETILQALKGRLGNLTE